MKLHKLRELGWIATELSRDRQAFTDAFNAYLTRFGNTNSRDNSEEDESDNKLALHGIINYVLLSPVKSSGSEIKRYLSEPMLKKSDKKSYTNY
jgi:hypothetical protein